MNSMNMREKFSHLDAESATNCICHYQKGKPKYNGLTYSPRQGLCWIDPKLDGANS